MVKPCGTCGGNRNKTVKWSWTKNGKTVSNLSEVEAKSRAVKFGGTAQPM